MVDVAVEEDQVAGDELAAGDGAGALLLAAGAVRELDADGAERRGDQA